MLREQRRRRHANRARIGGESRYGDGALRVHENRYSHTVAAEWIHSLRVTRGVRQRAVITRPPEVLDDRRAIWRGHQSATSPRRRDRRYGGKRNDISRVRKPPCPSAASSGTP